MRKIVITGASGGLAQEMVKLLADDYLILIGRDGEKLERLYGQAERLDLIEADITDSFAMEHLVEELYAKYGTIDILVNNAGYGYFEEFDKFEPEEIQAMFEVNTFALMNLSRLFGQRMKDSERGHIVNIVSMAGLIATNKSSVYSASKFAAIGFSNALRLELAEHGVYVTTVNPGPIYTGFFDQADPDGDYLKSVERFALQPDAVARKIVGIFGKKKREMNMPVLLDLAHKFYTLFPGVSDFLSRTVFHYK